MLLFRARWDHRLWHTLRESLSQGTQQQVTVNTRVDPDIIGGAVTRVGTLVYDGSLARQLARIKEQFVQQG